MVFKLLRKKKKRERGCVPRSEKQTNSNNESHKTMDGFHCRQTEDKSQLTELYSTQSFLKNKCKIKPFYKAREKWAKFVSGRNVLRKILKDVLQVRGKQTQKKNLRLHNNFKKK